MLEGEQKSIAEKVKEVAARCICEEGYSVGPCGSPVLCQN